MMDRNHLDGLLERSAPPTRSRSERIGAEIDALVASTRAAKRRTRLKQRLALLAVPVVAVPAALFATTASTDPRMVPDFIVQVSYQTDTGKQIECAIDFFNGEEHYVETSFEAVDFLKAQNWDGVGQRIYDLAIAYEAAGEAHPWRRAENDLTWKLLDSREWPDGTHAGGESHCAGELH